MVRNRLTGALEPPKKPSDILVNLPKLSEMMEIDFKFVCNIDSANMSPKYWSEIVKAICSSYDEFDGFVVTHGTDSMAYTSSAISFALKNVNKPIVFTGSVIPLSEVGDDGRNNLIYACITAALDIAEVCMVSGNRIIRGSRAKKYSESFVDVFRSPNYPYLGELGNPPRVFDFAKKKEDDRILVCMSDFEDRVVYHKLFPGFRTDALKCELKTGVEGVVLEGYGSGNLPFLNTDLIDLIKDLSSKEIPVVVTTQLPKGRTNLEAYESGMKALEAGAISAMDMTTEATVTKLMWTLANTRNYQEFKEVFSENLCGELTEER